ncbi:MAG: D-tyrosyl-tRNA(Tyr) deacylase [Clostridiales bacterium]|jgi:D-tyrosyl-tRNA(Tyr) deacylase|nr:D-tyrosyl-tRNA(Tyr) deacylase [Clostridiales bacterium]
MRAVLQRVRSAGVMVEGEELAAVGRGYLILLGVEQGDTVKQAKTLASKIASLRVFEDDNGKLNRSLLETNGEALVVSNFTLCADCRKGNRPSFTKAAPPQDANMLYEEFVGYLKQQGIAQVKTGRFGADMQLQLVNDGPVTIVLDVDQEGTIH